MKRIVGLIILLCANLFVITTYADVAMVYEELPNNYPTSLVDGTGNLDGVFDFVYRHCGKGLINVDNQWYIVNSGGVSPTSHSLPIKVAPHTSSQNLIWTGEHYYFRNSSMDGFGYSVDQFPAIYLLDENGNEIKSCAFSQPVTKIGYINDNYYVQLGEKRQGLDNVKEGRIMKSTNFQNWEETDEEVPELLGDIIVSGNEISIRDSDIFYPIKYENSNKTSLYYGLGKWLINIDEDNNFYFSNDNIYYVKADCPDDFEVQESIKDFDKIRYASTDDNSIFIEWDCYDYPSVLGGNKTGVRRFSLPKKEFITSLHNLKNAPYVVMNNTILGFENPPVIEDGSTLVPMRFLFEQMGADVDWNGATRTATATLDGTAVTFSIDNTQATVNKAPAKMAVPARLIDDKTMVPLRFLSEELGFTVTWDADTRTAIIE